MFMKYNFIPVKFHCTLHCTALLPGEGTQRSMSEIVIEHKEQLLLLLLLVLLFVIIEIWNY
jgi:hypothetical protein